MKFTASAPLLCAIVMLSACGGGNNAAPANITPANNPPANIVSEDTPGTKFDAVAARDATIAEAWTFLKTQYNVASPPDDKFGLLSGWGPKSYNIPYTALVLQGLVGTKIWDPKDPMIADSVKFLAENQEPSGGYSYAPLSVRPQAKGQRAVYITSIMAQLFVDLNGMEGPWKGKLNNEIGLARDYLKQSQVGNPEGPAADYDKKSVGFGGWAYSKEEIGKSVVEGGKPPANMSTTTFAIDALHACGLSESDPLWQDALVFLKRNQNSGEVQDEGFEAFDKASGKKIKPAEKGSPDYGGAVYSEETSMADSSQENADGTITLFSYGSMTYNLLRAYIFAGLKKDSIPVKLAWGWIQSNYTVKRVPGFRNKDQYEMGLYYYYLSMARTLEAFGVDTIDEPDRNMKHDWRADIVRELSERQKADGSWINEKHDRWQENSAVLCTAYALNALRHTK